MRSDENMLSWSRLQHLRPQKYGSERRSGVQTEDEDVEPSANTELGRTRHNLWGLVKNENVGLRVQKAGKGTIKVFKSTELLK